MEVAQNKFLAFMFMDGADKTKLGPLMGNLKRDFALGIDMCPVDPEDALRVLTTTEQQTKLAGSSAKRAALHAQVDTSKVRCWKCKELGHTKKDCPKNSERNDEGPVSGAGSVRSNHTRSTLTDWSGM